jgi:hypothetical protein
MAYKNLEKYRQWLENNKERLKEKRKDYLKTWKTAHRDYIINYQNTDLNLLGKTKNSIRAKSNYYLKKYGKKIKGYNIHHCCTYNEPYKFIYCSNQMHTLIHRYLRQHNIDADSDHYELIKHLLDDTVIKYNVD